MSKSCPVCGVTEVTYAHDTPIWYCGHGEVYSAEEIACSILEYDGAFRCLTHGAVWGAVRLSAKTVPNCTAQRTFAKEDDDAKE